MSCGGRCHILRAGGKKKKKLGCWTIQNVRFPYKTELLWAGASHRGSPGLQASSASSSITSPMLLHLLQGLLPPGILHPTPTHPHIYPPFKTELRHHLPEDTPLIPPSPHRCQAPHSTGPSLYLSQHLSLDRAISETESAQIPARRPGQVGTKSWALSSSSATVVDSRPRGRTGRHVCVAPQTWEGVRCGPAGC